jgi:hypothetical protein
MRIAHNIFVRKSKQYIPFGRYRSSTEDNIKVDIKVLIIGSVDSILLPHDRDQWPAHVNAVLNLRVT